MDYSPKQVARGLQVNTAPHTKGTELSRLSYKNKASLIPPECVPAVHQWSGRLYSIKCKSKVGNMYSALIILKNVHMQRTSRD